MKHSMIFAFCVQRSVRSPFGTGEPPYPQLLNAAWWRRRGPHRRCRRGLERQRLRNPHNHARAPIWSPDGKHLLFVGYASVKLHDDVNLDWRLATVDGSDEVKTGLHDALINAGLSIA